MIYFTGRNYSGYYTGAEILVINIITGLYAKNINTGIIGVKDNYAVRTLKEKNIPFTFINSNDKSIRLSKKDLLIFFTFTDELLKIKGNPNILIWDILSLSLINFNKTRFDKKKHLFKKINKALFKKMFLSNSLYFMDLDSKLEMSRYYNYKFANHLLPIPVISYYDNKVNPIIKDVINITYLGRGTELWKIMPVVKIYNDLNSLNSKLKFHLKIITDYDTYFKNKLKETDNLKISYYLGLKEKTLHSFLRKESNLHIAMGTSALEGSVNGLPTILIDASYENFPKNYKYKWIFETKEFSLGSFIENGIYTNGKHTFQDIINSITSNEEYIFLSQKCYEYSIKNHSIISTNDILMNIKPKFRLKQYLFYNKNYWKNLLNKRNN